MHTEGDVLVLPNVWDVASARVIEDAGCAAVATSSAGIAFAQGFPDGQKIPPRRMLGVIADIAKAVKVPVTADVEAGYGGKPEDAAQTAREVIEAGAVGMNFEDATGDPAHPLFDLQLQVERIRAVREVGVSLDVPLVVNARTDVYLLQIGETGQRYDEALRRMSAFRDAGADCVFVPGLVDLATIARFVADLRCPLNILAVPGSPSIAEVRRAGVRRISLGSGPMRAAMGLLRRIADELKETGTYSGLSGAPSHAEMNKLMG
ncbi:MAG TPA: isocitrate lyase/phosphoenolpyruvate mutase family protein [Candidatus Sulfotelmatobacter sp.]|nr:isocitrate lyase/phosphoenolpyruvate mutase family protein [Candidatus Sulfotelmatobacter sp.]